MEVWAVLEFAFALVTAIACIALTVERLHIIERAEAQEWRRELKGIIEKSK